MTKIMVCGIGTGIGKTVVSAILATAFNADYWKPIQTGDENASDPVLMRKLLEPSSTVFPPSYSLKARLSPHHAASLEKTVINCDRIVPPVTSRPIIIEGVGGILVPLTSKKTSLDIFKTWDCRWIVVSQHYLGSINHTLLTLETLKARNIPVVGVIFNGEPNPHSEEAILESSQLPLLCRLLPEADINKTTIQKYAAQWKKPLSHLIA